MTWPRLGNFLLDHPDEKLKIAGHTDSDGHEELNRKLSQDRADAIRTYLMEQFKIDASRITAIGYGSSKPIVQENSGGVKKIQSQSRIRTD